MTAKKSKKVPGPLCRRGGGKMAFLQPLLNPFSTLFDTGAPGTFWFFNFWGVSGPKGPLFMWETDFYPVPVLGRIVLSL